jgi:thymidine phosphorylase
MSDVADRKRHSHLHLKGLGIDTYREHVIYMSRDCHVCRSEGLGVRARVTVSLAGKSIVATLNVVDGDLLSNEEASLSKAAWERLGASEGDTIAVSHAPPLASDSFLRKKVYGGELAKQELMAIVAEIAGGGYDDIQLAAFITSCAGDRLSLQETIDLTSAMIDAGEKLSWGAPKVADKHCVGGLPGNRTSMIVVPIVAAAGIVIPKTSSRAITSPAGTADVMETVSNVDLDIARMRRVVEREGGCIAWGGSARLSPADDILIGVERPLDFDSEGQLVASVLSKKIAAGSTHVVLDLPVGATAKLRSAAAATTLAARLVHVANAFGLKTAIVQTDGTQPVGRGIGPALEAHDVLAVLQGHAGAPQDLKTRAVALAARLLELVEAVPTGSGASVAEQLLASGAAWRKFQNICEAQGGMRIPGAAGYRLDIKSPRAGKVAAIHNRKLAKVAKLAGAPGAPLAGVVFHAPLGSLIERDRPFFTIHAETEGELAYAYDFVRTHDDIVQLGETA